MILYIGSPLVEVLLVVVAALAAWEWVRLCRVDSSDFVGMVSIAGITVCAVVGAFGFYGPAIALTGLLGLSIGLLARRSDAGVATWLAFGAVYLTLPILAFLWLRLVPEEGRALIFWLLFVVWATDTGAYVFGRMIGGPKLAPKISPKKTWAGLLGGMAMAALLGALCAYLFGLRAIAPLALAGAGLAVVAQAGDLFESAAKRHFDVKDSSFLIPGHGGILDRIDGLMAAVLLMASVVSWQEVGSKL